MLEEKCQTHLVNKTIAHDIKASEKLLFQNNPQSIASSSFDLPQVLNVPSDIKDLFNYTCMVIAYNLAIIDLVNKDGFCYTWNQTTAKRGANGSCICFHLKEYLKDHE